MRGQTAGDVAPGGALSEGRGAVIDQFLAFDAVGRRVDLAHQRHPVGRAAGVDVVQLFVAQAQDARQRLEAGVVVGDVLLHDFHLDRHATLVDQYPIVAVVDVGPRGQEAREDQIAAPGHLREDVRRGPGHAPTLVRDHQTQGAPGILEVAQEAGGEGHVVADRHRVALAQTGVDGEVQVVQGHLLGGVLVDGDEVLLGRGFPAAEGHEAVHILVMAVLPRRQEGRADAFGVLQRELDRGFDRLLGIRRGRRGPAAGGQYQHEQQAAQNQSTSHTSLLEIHNEGHRAQFSLARLCPPN